MLVLLMGGIYVVFRSDGFMWHDIHTKFHDVLLRYSCNIKVITSKSEKLQCSCRADPRQHSYSWFLVSSVIVTKFLFFLRTLICLEMGLIFMLSK
jgi:hypothetical protein